MLIHKPVNPGVESFKCFPIMDLGFEAEGLHVRASEWA